VILPESGETEDDGGCRDDDNVTVGALYRTQSLSVERPTHGDVSVNGQQYRQPGVQHAQHVGAREQPVVKPGVDVFVVVVVDLLRDVTQ